MSEKKPTPKTETEKVKRSLLQLWDIPMDVKTDFKAACAKNHKSMKEVVIEMMEEYIKNAEL